MSLEYYNPSFLEFATQKYFRNHDQQNNQVYVALISETPDGNTSFSGRLWDSEFNSRAGLTAANYSRFNISSNTVKTIVDEPYEIHYENDQYVGRGINTDIVFTNTSSEYWPPLVGWALLSDNPDLSLLPTDADRQAAWEKILIAFHKIPNSSPYRSTSVNYYGDTIPNAGYFFGRSLWPGDSIRIESDTFEMRFGDAASGYTEDIISHWVKNDLLRMFFTGVYETDAFGNEVPSNNTGTIQLYATYYNDFGFESITPQPVSMEIIVSGYDSDVPLVTGDIPRFDDIKMRNTNVVTFPRELASFSGINLYRNSNKTDKIGNFRMQAENTYIDVSYVVELPVGHMRFFVTPDTFIG